jgi:hypothetical protein
MLSLQGKEMAEQTKYYVYALSDPRTYRPRYIGVTINLEKRYDCHINSILNRNIPNRRLSRWILELNSLALIPILVPLDVRHSEKEAWLKEADYISVITDIGGDLCNVLSSGRRNKRIKPYERNSNPIRFYTKEDFKIVELL